MKDKALNQYKIKSQNLGLKDIDLGKRQVAMYLSHFDNIDSDNESYKKQKIAMNIGHINHDRARALLFKLMNENIERWWD